MPLRNCNGKLRTRSVTPQQLNPGSFAEFIPVEKSDRWVQTKVLKLPSQKSVVHPESEVRALICLMRAWGAETGSQKQKTICEQKVAKGKGGQHRGRARLTSFSQKKGKSWELE